MGDTPYDVERSGRRGMQTVALRLGGFADEELLEAGALALHDSAAALLECYDASRLAANGMAEG